MLHALTLLPKAEPVWLSRTCNTFWNLPGKSDIDVNLSLIKKGLDRYPFTRNHLCQMSGAKVNALTVLTMLNVGEENTSTDDSSVYETDDSWQELRGSQRRWSMQTISGQSCQKIRNQQSTYVLHCEGQWTGRESSKGQWRWTYDPQFRIRGKKYFVLVLYTSTVDRYWWISSSLTTQGIAKNIHMIGNKPLRMIGAQQGCFLFVYRMALQICLIVWSENFFVSSPLWRIIRLIECKRNLQQLISEASCCFSS